jgi:hypothetical protein
VVIRPPGGAGGIIGRRWCVAFLLEVDRGAGGGGLRVSGRTRAGVFLLRVDVKDRDLAVIVEKEEWDLEERVY